jgi:hypothetical protein
MILFRAIILLNQDLESNLNDEDQQNEDLDTHIYGVGT